jgi:hypothetical protein
MNTILRMTPTNHHRGLDLSTLHGNQHQSFGATLNPTNLVHPPILHGSARPCHAFGAAPPLPPQDSGITWMGSTSTRPLLEAPARMSNLDFLLGRLATLSYYHSISVPLLIPRLLPRELLAARDQHDDGELITDLAGEHGRR